MPPFASHRHRLDGQQFATYRRPGQPGHLAYFALFFSDTVVEFPDTQKVRQHFRCHLDGALEFTDCKPLDHLAADLGDFALQTPDASLLGVIADDIKQGRTTQTDLIFLQAVLLHLFWRQVALTDVQLFVFRVSGNTDHFHSIQQRPGNIHGV